MYGQPFWPYGHPLATIGKARKENKCYCRGRVRPRGLRRSRGLRRRIVKPQEVGEGEVPLRVDLDAEQDKRICTKHMKRYSSANVEQQQKLLIAPKSEDLY